MPNPQKLPMPMNIQDCLTSWLSMGDLYYAYVRPVWLKAINASPRTIAEADTSVRLWVAITGDPPLRSIENSTCALFVAHLLDRPGRKKDQTLSPNTARKHCSQIQIILNLAGPQTRDFPWAVSQYGLFGEDRYGRPRIAPWFCKPPKRDKLPEDGFTIEEIGQLLEACPKAKKPKIPGCTPAAWWRALICFSYNTGIRIGSLLQLRRSWIRRQADEGWINIPAEAEKKNRPKTIYLSPQALTAIDTIGTGELIFAWPESIVSLQRYRRHLLAIAGIPQERWFGFHGFRKAIGTELWSIDPKAAQLQLGHEDAATTRRSYVNPSVIGQAQAAMIGPAMRRVRQPHQADS